MKKNASEPIKNIYFFFNLALKNINKNPYLLSPDGSKAIKAIANYKKLSKATAEVLSGAKKSYKLLLDLEPEKLDEIVSKLNPDVAQKLLSSEHGTEKRR